MISIRKIFRAIAHIFYHHWSDWGQPIKRYTSTNTIHSIVQYRTCKYCNKQEVNVIEEF